MWAVLQLMFELPGSPFPPQHGVAAFAVRQGAARRRAPPVCRCDCIVMPEKLSVIELSPDKSELGWCTFTASGVRLQNVTDPTVERARCPLLESMASHEVGASKNLVVVKGSRGAGLGDKIRALPAALLLASVTNRAVWVDWDDKTYGSDSGNLFPKLFKLTGVDGVQSCPSVSTLSPPIWGGNLGLPLARLRANDLRAQGITWPVDQAPPRDPIEETRRYSWDAGDLNDPAEAWVITSMLSAGPVYRLLRRAGAVPPDMSDASLTGWALRRHLRASARVRAKVGEFLEKSQWKQGPIVGVHVRHTTESERARSMPRLAEYVAACDEALKIWRDARVFLATDNISVVHLFRERYGANQVLTVPKWFAEAGHPLHKNPDCPDGVAAAEDAVVDIALLASSSFLISLANSSFSIVASALSTAAAENRRVLSVGVPAWRRAANRLTGLWRR